MDHTQMFMGKQQRDSAEGLLRGVDKLLQQTLQVRRDVLHRIGGKIRAQVLHVQVQALAAMYGKSQWVVGTFLMADAAEA